MSENLSYEPEYTFKEKILFTIAIVVFLLTCMIIGAILLEGVFAFAKWVINSF